MKQAIVNGWLIAEVTERLILQTEAAYSGGEERVQVYTQDEDGSWYRTYVEVVDFGEGPYVKTERVDGPPQLKEHHTQPCRWRGLYPYLEQDRCQHTQ